MFKKYPWIIYIITIVVLFVGLSGIAAHSYLAFTKYQRNDLQRSGGIIVQGEATSLNQIIAEGELTIQGASFMVEQLQDRNASAQEIEEYLKRLKSQMREKSDSSFSGYYGVVNDEYVNASGWIGGVGYVPTKRPWYREAIKARGRVVLVPPFTVAGRDEVVVGLSIRLSDKKSVVALNIPLSKIKSLMGHHISSGDQWFLMDGTGLIVAHSKDNMQGVNLLSAKYWGTPYEKLARNVQLLPGGNFDFEWEGNYYSVFSAKVHDNWYAVRLFNITAQRENNRAVLIRNVCIALGLFAFLAILCAIGVVLRRNAERDNEAKTRFLEFMCNEIRGPVNGILGLVPVMLKETKNETLRKYVTSVGDAGHMALEMINEIYDATLVESDQLSLNMSEYNLGDVLGECFDLISPRAAAKNLRFSIDCDPDIPVSMWGDKIRIRQIINHLLFYAIQNTEVGAVQLLVSFDSIYRSSSVSSENTMNLKITVKDTNFGKLIAADGEGRFRGKKMIWGEGDGKSIAYGLVRALVAKCGGELVAKSYYGEGTTVFITIPQLVLNTESMGDFAKRYKNHISEDKTPIEKIFAPGARILVLDSEELGYQIFRGMLAESKIAIDYAKSAAQCVDLASSRHYDMIFLDNTSPAFNASEVFEDIKALENKTNAQTPVILMTMFKTSDKDEAYLKVGFADYVVKPFKERDILRLLKWYLPKDQVLTMEDVVLPQRKSESESIEEETKPKTSARTRVETKEVSSGDDEIELQQVTTLPAVEKLALFNQFLNVKVGLEYCANDEDFFREMLTEYVNDYKLDSINSTFAKKDWKNYQILVHALKGTSLTIGAENLSEDAKSLEVACKEGRYEFVQENHERIMLEYRELVVRIKEGLGEL